MNQESVLSSVIVLQVCSLTLSHCGPFHHQDVEVSVFACSKTL